MKSTKHVLVVTFLSIATGAGLANAATTATTTTTTTTTAPTKLAAPPTTTTTIAPAPTTTTTVAPTTTTTTAPTKLAAPTTTTTAAPAPAPTVTAPAPLNLGITTGISSGKSRESEEGAEHGRGHGDHANKGKDDRRTFSGSINGDTLTIEAISSDFLKVGSPINGRNIPKGTKIAEFLTGKGGVGTYRISVGSDD